MPNWKGKATAAIPLVLASLVSCQSTTSQPPSETIGRPVPARPPMVGHSDNTGAAELLRPNAAGSVRRLLLTPPQPSDDFASAPEIQLPFTVVVDTRQATAEAVDSSPCHGEQEATVWYRFSSSRALDVFLRTQGSSYSVPISVFQGVPNPGTLVACGTDYTLFHVDPGTDYYISFGDLVGGDVGGDLTITGEEFIFPDVTDFVLDPVARVLSGGTKLRLTGAVSANRPLNMGAFAAVRQLSGRVYLSASGQSFQEAAGGRVSWTLDVDAPPEGLWKSGSAQVDVGAFGCETFFGFCDSENAPRQTIRVKR